MDIRKPDPANWALADMLFGPYVRIGPMLAVVAGMAWFGGVMFPIWLVLKTAVDAIAHMNKHSKGKFIKSAVEKLAGKT